MSDEPIPESWDGKNLYSPSGRDMKCPSGWPKIPCFSRTYTQADIDEIRRQNFKDRELLDSKALKYGGTWG